MSKRSFLDQGRPVHEPAKAAQTFGYTEQRVLGVDTSDRTVTAIVSTAAVDSYREVVLPEAFENRLPDRFNKNAPLIAGHTYHAEDGSPGKIGEWVEMGVRDVPGVGRALVGKAKIFSGYKLADDCWQIIRQSRSIAFSVGWLTHAWEPREFEVDGKKQKLRVYTDVELVEVSFVTVPANPEAVVQASIAARSSPGWDFAQSLGEPQLTLERLIRQNEAMTEQLKTVLNLVNALAGKIDEDLSAEPGGKLHELVLNTIRLEQRRGHQGGEADGVQPKGVGNHPALQYLGL